MDPGSVISGVTAVVKVIGFIVEHSKKGTPKYAKEYKDSVMKFKGVDTRGALAAWWDEWYWIDQATEKNQKQFVYQDMSFYLPKKATQTQLNWVEHLLSKDTVDLQDLKNWFELLEDSTQFYFKNIYLFDEIVETARKLSNPQTVEPTKYYLRKRAHIVLANDDQALSAPGVDIVKQLGDVGLSQKLLYVWKNIPGPTGVTAKQITVANANTSGCWTATALPGSGTAARRGRRRAARWSASPSLQTARCGARTRRTSCTGTTPPTTSGPRTSPPA